MDVLHSQLFLNQGRNMPARINETFARSPLARVDHVTPKINPVITPTVDIDMEQKLMQLAFQQSARIQKVQIDAAISLLQKEYEKIMARMIQQSAQDRIHQESLYAVQNFATLGSNVAKMSAPTFPHSSHSGEPKCFSESRNEVACSQDRKRHRDESYVMEQDVEAAHSGGHGKVVLTCEVCAAFVSAAFVSHQLTFLVPDRVRNLPVTTEDLGPEGREIRLPKLQNRCQIRRDCENCPRHLVRPFICTRSLLVSER
jgi:hypothetical protein